MINLLEQCGGDVNAAANAFFEGGVPMAPPVNAVPVAQPQSAMVQVTCPAELSEGDELQVQTELGLMRVVIPRGVTGGSTFLLQ